jgi:predicted RNase H-related nuclease YkuK (DUF458 family)
VVECFLAKENVVGSNPTTRSKGEKMKRIDIDQVIAFIDAQSPETKIYIGADSERFQIGKEWFADYTLAIVVHIDGCHGCKIFGEVQRERDFEYKKDRPRMRLMNEVYKIADLYLKLKDVLEDREVEVHLDINPNEMHGSSCVINEAVGYIRGMCNVVPLVKPRAFAASYAADRLKSLKVA